MPIARLTFKLPEEREEFLLAQKGGSYMCVLNELDNWLRNTIKHTDQKDWPDAEAVRSKLHELLEEHEVSIHI